MKKRNITKKGAVLTLAAVMAFGLYSPVAVFATEVPEDETPAIEQQEAPAAEKQSAPVAKEVAPVVKEELAAQEAPAVEEEQTPAVEEEQTPAVEEEQTPAAEGSPYGEATGNWGYGNSSQTTQWVEYTKDGETILVFSVIGEGNTDEENAVTQLLDENGNSVKDALKARVTQIIFETGITGIGWTALYDKSGYDPVYGEGYTVDRTQTDLFNSFKKLTTVIPCETIQRIGWSAFRKCDNLSFFDFSMCTGLQEIMNQAFSECRALNNVDLSNCNALQLIAWSAFYNAGRGSDASLALPSEGVLSIIGGHAFYNFAMNNSNNAEVDFSVVAGSVTQVLQNAFAGSRIAGEIIGFPYLETIGKNALGAYITYVAYDPSQDEKEEPAAEEPAVEEPAAEEPVVEEPAAEEPVVEDPVVEDEIMPVSEDEVVPEEDDVISIIQEQDGIVTAIEETAKAAVSTKAAASGKTAVSNAAAFSDEGAVISNNASPAAAPAQEESISDGSVAMTAPAGEEQTLPAYLFGAFALASLLSLAAAIVLMRKTYKEDR